MFSRTPRRRLRRDARKHANGGSSPLSALCLLIPASLLWAVAPAQAASFKLSDGLRLEGEISAAGRRYVTVSTKAGARLVARRALVEISVRGKNGQPLTGKFKGWSEGVYTLTTPEGEFSSIDHPEGGATPQIAAAAPASAPKASEQAEAPKPARASDTGEKAAAVKAPSLSAKSDQKATAQKAAKTGAKTGAKTAAKTGSKTAAQTTQQTAKNAAGAAELILPPAASAAAEAAESPPAAPQKRTPANIGRNAPPDVAPALDPEKPAFAGLEESDRMRGKLNDILSAAPSAAAQKSSAKAPPPNQPGRAASAQLSRSPAQFSTRDPATDYRAALLGEAKPAPERARSCSRLSRLLAPPLASPVGGAKRSDPKAVATTLGGDYARESFATLAAAYYAASGARALAAQFGDDEANSVRVDIAEDRLALPLRLSAERQNDPRAAALLSAGGRADLVLSAEHSPGAKLIALDAVALIAAKKNPLKSISRRDLKRLLSGEVTDWSMLQNALIGAPRLYLPPLRSRELRALTEFTGARRVQPASVRYIADPKQRLAAALADPLGLAVVSRSAQGELSPVAIGRPSAGVKPTLDAIRNGAYPLLLPVYASAPENPAHPASSSFAAFLSSPAGQRAIYSAGLFPVAACDPSTCALRTKGMDAARKLLRSPSVKPLTSAKVEEIPIPAVSPALARVEFAPGRQRPPTQTVDKLAESISSLASGQSAARKLIVAARAGKQGEKAEPAQERDAAIRAEAVALALRCAGLKAARYAVDPSPRYGGGVQTPDGVSVEIIVDTGR